MRAAAILLIVVGLGVGFLGTTVDSDQGQIGMAGGILVFCGVLMLILAVFMASRREAILSVTEQYESMRGPDGEMPEAVDLSEDPDRMLSALGKLRDKGIITEAQFEEQRRRLFDS